MAAVAVSAMPAVACSQQRASSSGQRVAFRPFSRALAAKPLVQQQAAAPAVARRSVAVSAAAAAAPAQQKIRIKLKSYWVDLLADSVEKIREAASSTGATIAGPVPLPTRCVWPRLGAQLGNLCVDALACSMWATCAHPIWPCVLWASPETDRAPWAAFLTACAVAPTCACFAFASMPLLLTAGHDC